MYRKEKKIRIYTGKRRGWFVENTMHLIRHLELERLGLFPGELGTAKVTISSGLLVDGSEQIEFLDDDTRTQVPVVSDDSNKLFLGLVRGAIGLNENRQWAGNTNSIRQLDSSSAGNLGGDERQSNVSGDVSTGTIDLGEVL